MQVVSREMLEDIARMRPSFSRENRSGNHHPANGRGFDLAEWIEKHEVPIKREGEWGTGGRRYVLKECPWNRHADNSGYIVRFDNGAIAAGCHHNSCQGYGWRDLREHYEPGCYDRPGTDDDSFIESGGTATELPPALPFPLTSFPTTLRRFVQEAAEAIGCPPEFIAVPMLATLGAAIGNSRVLELKKGWTEGATLYAAVVADPGSKKTPAQKVATRPAWRRQAEYKREYEEAMADYHREKREWDAERRRASSEDEPAPESPQEPVLSRTVVEDTTMEALVSRLEENPRGLLCAKDELSGWVRALDQYKGGKGSDRQSWLSVWSNHSIVVDRKGRREPMMIPRPSVGLVGSIQPGVLTELKNYREDGLVDRFLFAYPDHMPSRWSDNEISDQAFSDYHWIYDRLSRLVMTMDDNGEPSPQRLSFTPEAKAAFIKEADSLKEEMERFGFPERLKGPWSKLEAYLARLSLILALARSTEEENLLVSFGSADMVEERDVRAAAELVAYFKAHTRRVHAKLHGEKPDYLLTEALKNFLYEKGGTWEGQPSELYEILKVRSAPGLPGGEGAFGKQLRRIVRQTPDLGLEEGWQGNVYIVKIALFTPGTPGEEGAM